VNRGSEIAARSLFHINTHGLEGHATASFLRDIEGHRPTFGCKLGGGFLPAFRSASIACDWAAVIERTEPSA
jgi:hypothetical protein